jgi:hypothetical protein
MLDCGIAVSITKVPCFFGDDREQRGEDPAVSEDTVEGFVTLGRVCSPKETVDALRAPGTIALVMFAP